MILEIKSMELYVSPMKQRNINKFGQVGNQCECCGKLMKDSDYLTVHMGVDWMAYNVGTTTVVDGVEFITGTDVESQGCFPIGNDCAKKMKGFTF
jgi:bacterioferritin-associated ferredoxin